MCTNMYHACQPMCVCTLTGMCPCANMYSMWVSGKWPRRPRRECCWSPLGPKTLEQERADLEQLSILSAAPHQSEFAAALLCNDTIAWFLILCCWSYLITVQRIPIGGCGGCYLPHSGSPSTNSPRHGGTPHVPQATRTIWKTIPPEFLYSDIIIKYHRQQRFTSSQF